MRAAIALLMLASLTAANDTETSALFAAVRANNATAVRAAAAAGARINEQQPPLSPAKQTPLMHASLTGAPEAAAALLELGADPSLGEKDGYTPLHGAAFQGRAAVARVLLADSRVPNARHADGNWPIPRACWGREARHADTVRAFLENGGGLELRNGEGHTPLDLARRSGNALTIDLLTNWGGAGDEL